MNVPTTLLHPRSFSQWVFPEMPMGFVLHISAAQPDILSAASLSVATNRRSYRNTCHRAIAWNSPESGRFVHPAQPV